MAAQFGVLGAAEGAAVAARAASTTAFAAWGAKQIAIVAGGAAWVSRWW